MKALTIEMSFLLLAALATTGGGRALGTERDSLFTVAMAVVDDIGGQSLATRCHVTDSEGVSRHPLPADACFFTKSGWQSSS